MGGVEGSGTGEGGVEGSGWGKGSGTAIGGLQELMKVEVRAHWVVVMVQGLKYLDLDQK